MPLYGAYQRSVTAWRRFPLLWMWCVGALIGLVFAAAMTSSIGMMMKSYMEGRMQTEMTQAAFWRCLIVNGRFMAFLVAATYLPFSRIWLQVLLTGYGFFFGFSLQIMARVYGFAGIISSVFSYIPHNLCLLPVLAMVTLWIREDGIGQTRSHIWIVAAIMAVLSALVEMNTAPAIFNWCLGGRL